MEQESNKLMTPFDCLTIPQWIHLLKLMLPYTPSSMQHSLAVFIRFQEMQFTLRHFHGFPSERHFDNIIKDVKPYMDSTTQDMMDQMESMMSMMEMMQMTDLSDLFNMKGDPENE